MEETAGTLPGAADAAPFAALPESLAKTLAGRGYTALTAVQAQVIEPEALGRDLVVSARTGSGKTVAFGLAMGMELLAEGKLPAAGAPLSLIVAPSRELTSAVAASAFDDPIPVCPPECGRK